jgi:hypothetical protein
MLLMSRIKIVLLASLVLAVAVLAAARSQGLAAEPAATFATGAAQVANSRDGSAIVGGTLGPGSELTGSVTISNVGSAAGAFSLQVSHLTDTPGGGGGFFSRQLDLAVDDVTAPASPVKVYSGKLNSLNPTQLGSFAAGSSRTYRFTVSWPSGGASDASYYGSSMSVQFDWLATSDTPVTPTPTPAPPPVTPSAPVLTPPKLTFAAPSSQRVLRQKAVLAGGSCDQACTISAKGTLSIPGTSAVYKLAPASKKLTTAGSAKLKLKVSKKTLAKLRNALKAHRKATATVTVTATGTGGSAQALKRKIKVRG